MSQSGGSAFSPLERQDARIVSREYLPPNVYSVRVHAEPLDVVNAPDNTGTYMPLRLLYDSITVSGNITQRLVALGYPPQEANRLRFLARRTGMVLISGPVNSGKTTVLRHVFEGLGEEFPEKNYVSIEDPSEYPMRNVKQLKWNLGQDVRANKMADAHNGVLRCDPNALLLGEIRHAETADLALTSALTGHAVWSTIHALNAFEIITRLRNLLVKNYPGNPMDILCNYRVLAGLVYQRLIPTLCPYCKESLTKYVERRDSERAHILPEDVYNRLLGVVPDPRTVYVRGKGCDSCRNLGFAGMKLAVEVVVTDAKLLDLIRQGRQEEAETYWRQDLGGKSHVDHAIEYISAGKADPAHTEVVLGVHLDMGRALLDLSRTNSNWSSPFGESA
jgi:type II secretory ATPase GspE/PulE/Tfp pilus assembly ATPase PilB-like protein